MFKTTSLRALMRAAVIAASPLALAPLAVQPAAAQEFQVPSGAYAMDATHASIVFKVSHLGLSDYTARFNSFEINLQIDGENPAASTVSARIDPTSVDTDFPGEKDFNGEIANDSKFLNSGDFPEITFTSTNVEVTSDTTAKVTGDLTLLGVTQPVTLDVTLNGAIERHPFAGRPALGFSAVGELDRTAWGQTHLANTYGGTDKQIVGSTVTVLIEAEFIQAE